MHYHVIDCGEHVRLWRSTDFGDVFTVLDGDKAKAYLALIEKRPTEFVAGFPEDDAGTLTCALCLAEQAAARAAMPKRRGRPVKHPKLQVVK